MTVQQPRMVPVKVGWAAVGDGWAVFAPSRSDAERRYREAEEKHLEIEMRDGSAQASDTGVLSPQGARRIPQDGAT